MERMTRNELIEALNTRYGIWAERQRKLGIVFRDENIDKGKRLKSLALGLKLGNRLFNLAKLHMRLTSVDNSNFEQGGISTNHNINFYGNTNPKQEHLCQNLKARSHFLLYIA